MAFSGNSLERVAHNLPQPIATYCNQKFAKILLAASLKPIKFLLAAHQQKGNGVTATPAWHILHHEVVDIA